MHPGSCLIRARKERGGPLSTSQKRFHRQVPEFAIFRANLAEVRFKVRLLHCLRVAVRASSKPWKATISDIPNLFVALSDQVPCDFSGTAHVVGEDAVVLSWIPISDNVISD